MADEKKMEKTSVQRLNNPWIPVAIMVLLVIAVFAKFLFSDRMLVSSDQMSGFDARVFLKTAIEKYHQFPFWFSSRLGGMPTIDALFGDAIYPPSIVVSLFTSVARGIGMKMILHVLFAGIFFFLMLYRGFGLPVLISLTGAVFYMFNPQFVSHIYPGHDGKMFVLAWLPFIIWRIKMLMDVPTLKNMTLVGLGVGMSILTSHIQMTYFVLWGAGLYWVMSVCLSSLVQKDHKRSILLSVVFWSAVVLGLGIGALQIFPSFLYIRDAFSMRGVERGFEFAASWSLHWPEVFSLWVPEFVNSLDFYWGDNPFKLNSEYAGMVPVLFSIAAIVAKPKNPWRIFWGSVAVGTVLFSLGAHTPVFHIAYYLVPGVKKFRAASMIMFWFSFSTVLLSALFLKDMASGYFRNLSEKRQRQWARGLLIAAGLCLAVTLLFSSQGVVKGFFAETLSGPGKENKFELNFSKNFLPFVWLWLIFALAIIGSVWAVLRNKLSPAFCTIIILIIGIIDILRVDLYAAWNPQTKKGGFIQLTNPAPYFYRDPALTPLINEMHRTPFRCLVLPGALPQNGAGIHGLEACGGYHDNELRWYREFRGDQQNRNYLMSLVGMNAQGQPYLRAEKLSEGNPFLNLANARYLLIRNGAKLMTVRNENALERLSFVPGYTVMDSNAIVDALRNGTYDYRKNVALFAKPELPGKFSLPADTAENAGNSLQARWETYTPNYRKASITAPSDGFIRIAEVFYPAWEIRLDGERRDFYRADLAWMAIPVTEGKHTVELRPHSLYIARFAPVSFILFGAVTVYWLILGLGYLKNRKK